MLMPDHQLLHVNGIELSLYTAGPERGPAVWLLHGFPECWYSWRHQIEHLAASGYRVFMPEMRGYGDSSAPQAVDAYDLLTVCADIQCAMDYLGHTRVCVIGHDWGAPVAWHLALLEPQRVAAVVGMAVPYGGRPKQPATALMGQLYAQRYHYILHFQTPGVAEAQMDADPARTLRMMMHNTSAAVPKDFFLQEKPASAGLFDGLQDPGTLPDWCSDMAFAVYVRTFAKHGFRGALNWYRNFERNWLRTESLAERIIEQPALFLLGDLDPVGTLEAYTLKQMPNRVRHLEQHLIKACGHWIQNEQPAQVNELLLAFLQRHYSV